MELKGRPDPGRLFFVGIPTDSVACKPIYGIIRDAVSKLEVVSAAFR